MGKKYIIEKDDNESIWSIYADADGDATIEGVSLTPYTDPDMEQVRKEAYQQGVVYGRMCEREKIFKTLEKFSGGDTDIDCLTMGDFRTIMELSKRLQKMKETDND